MSSTLPLAAASARLRGKPGRPRTRPAAVPKERITTAAVGTLQPRLLDISGLAAYLSISEWSARDLVSRGVIPRVSIPLGSKDFRRVVVDRQSVDALLEQWREPAS